MRCSDLCDKFRSILGQSGVSVGQAFVLAADGRYTAFQLRVEFGPEFLCNLYPHAARDLTDAIFDSRKIETLDRAFLRTVAICEKAFQIRIWRSPLFSIKDFREH
jgi:hypothetical protein